MQAYLINVVFGHFGFLLAIFACCDALLSAHSRDFSAPADDPAEMHSIGGDHAE